MTIEIFTAHGGGRYWQRLLAEWRAAGHNVRQFSAFDDDAYRRKRSHLGRLWLRVRTYVLFPLQMCGRLLTQPPSEGTVRLIITSPFFLPGLAAAISRVHPGPPLVNLVNDLFPDGLVQAGMLRADGFLSRQIAILTRCSLTHCAASVFLGHRLQAYATGKYGPVRASCVIPVGADATFVRQEPPPPLTPGIPLRVLYSGTLGHMHDTATLVDAVHFGIPAGMRVTFHGSGVGYARLQSQLATAGGGEDPQIQLKHALSDQAWREALCEHPIGLVTLKAGAEKVSMPSKTYSALAAGQAILAICPLDSDLAALIQAHDCGWVVAPGCGEELAHLMERLVQNPAEVHARQQRAFRAGHAFYDMAVVARQYLDLFATLLPDAGPASRPAVPPVI